MLQLVQSSTKEFTLKITSMLNFLKIIPTA